MEYMLMPLRRYADFAGRSCRKEFWLFQLFNILVSAVLLAPLISALVANALAGRLSEDTSEFDALAGVGPFALLATGIYAVYALAIFIPGIALVVRRLHDRDMSGWWYAGFVLAGLVPMLGFVSSIALLVLMLLPGTSGPNRFGPDPRDPYNADIFG